MRPVNLIILSATLLIALSADLAAQNWNVEQVSSYYGLWESCWDVVVQGNFAYLANYNSGMSVVDVSNSAAPVMRGQLDFNLIIDRLSVQGNLACLKSTFTSTTEISSYFIMVDISNPDSLVESSQVSVPGLQDIVLIDQYVYAASFDRGLLIYDVSQPSAPLLVGNLAMPYHTRQLAVSGNYAYVTVLQYGLFVVDVSNPAEPRFAGFARLYSGSEYEDVEYHAGMVYVDGYNKVYLIDVSNPSVPILTSQITLSTYSIFGIAAADAYLFTAEASLGKIYNIVNPFQPALISTYNTQGYARDLWAADDYLYIADGGSFRIFEVANPLLPEEVSAIDSLGYLRSVAKQGDLIYLGDYVNGLRIVNVANPVAPVEISRCFAPLTDQLMNVTVTDSFAYLACSGNGLVIVDISPPEWPSIVGNYDPSGSVNDVDVAGNYAYLACLTAGLRIVDVSDPYNPVQIGLYNTPDMARCVTVVGDYAYVGDWSYFEIINVSNPAQPVLVGSLDYDPGTTLQIEVQGNYAYIVGKQVLLKIVDISDPFHPRAVYTQTGASSQEAHTISLQDNFAAVGTNHAGLQILDVSNPTRPAVVGYHKLSNSSWGVVLEGIYAYCADEYQFDIFDCSDALNPWIEVRGNDVRISSQSQPESFAVSPNPFNPTTVLSFELRAASYVKLEVFDLKGQRVGTGLAPVQGGGRTPALQEMWYPAGTHQIPFDGTNLPSGIYFAKLTAGDFSVVQKLILLK